ncbi:MAG: NADH-quinone oxidoreductase subunit NuoK [Candidatus Neomarinimicrobiota bacterium]
MGSLSTYLSIGAVLFALGLYGVITRRNGVAVLMGVELILNSANVNFIAFARFGGMNLGGHVFSLFVIVMAAAEVVVALAIIINIYNNLGTVNIDDAASLRH